MKPTKVIDLKPGQEVYVWFLESGAASTVKSVAEVERPGAKYNAVRVIFEDDTVFRTEAGYLPLVNSKVLVSR